MPSYNGESIGHFEGDTLVVRTKYFETDNHWIDLGIPISDKFEMVERIRWWRRQGDGDRVHADRPRHVAGRVEIDQALHRADYTDINEANCILAYNANLPGTELGSETAEERGMTAIEEDDQ